MPRSMYRRARGMRRPRRWCGSLERIDPMKCTALDDDLVRHYKNVVNFMLDGRIVPFLGAGANMCGRPHDMVWHAHRTDFLPSGAELSRHLAKQFDCPEEGDL